MSIKDELNKRILILDGAMGTSIQNYGLNGCSEKFNETHPHIIQEIHLKYLQAGADIIETNSFNSNAFSLADFGLPHDAYKLSYQAAKLAREVVDKFNQDNNKCCYVAASVGPTNKSCSIDGDFEMMQEVYREQIGALIDGGVDLILIETIFDGLNAKAALMATQTLLQERELDLPVFISATVDKKGNIFSGQNIASLIQTLDRDCVLAWGLNCSFGAKDLVPLLSELANLTSKHVLLYPNAGLPNTEGLYSETPEIMLSHLKSLIDNQKINLVGGCCGTTYSHIESLSNYSIGKKPRTTPSPLPTMLSGLAVLPIKPCYIVGERANLYGSLKFKKLIESEQYEVALEIVRSQLLAGADIIDINLDDDLLDSKAVMTKFLKLLRADPMLSQIPIMIDSSDFEVVKVALQLLCGRSIVNSISLKDGEANFLYKAKTIKHYGSSFVVMAFDEEGQATTAERKIAICKRAMTLLKQHGFTESEVAFDVNILTIGCGNEQERLSAQATLEAIATLKQYYPACYFVGGISNISFAFRGHNYLRNALNYTFLEQAKIAGLNMAIINPQDKAQVLSAAESELLTNLIKGQDISLEKLLQLMPQENASKSIIVSDNLTTSQRLQQAFITGSSLKVEDDINELLKEYEPLNLIQEILMPILQKIGDLFESGKIYLPQIISSAVIMKQCLALLLPLIPQHNNKILRGKVIIATVDGDVHDIGKNIVSTVLYCNGFEVIDLGIMCKATTLLQQAKTQQVDAVLLSGLISPSLKEMAKVISLFKEHELDIPIIVGGAATSKTHTAIKLSPLNPRLVFFASNPSSLVFMLDELKGSNQEQYINSLEQEMQTLATTYALNKKQTTSLFTDNSLKFKQANIIKPKQLGHFFTTISLKEVEPHIDFNLALHALKVKKTHLEQSSLQNLQDVYEQMKKANYEIKCAYGFFNCQKNANILTINHNHQTVNLSLPYGANNSDASSLADFFASDDYVGLFLVSVQGSLKQTEPLLTIIEDLVATRIAEAATVYLHQKLSSEVWPIAIRPAVGYPCLSDHSMMSDIFTLLEAEKTGASLSSNHAISPKASTCGLFLGNPLAHYLNIAHSIE